MKLQIGTGDYIPLEGYVHQHYREAEGAEMVSPIDSIPLPDEACSAVAATHVLEHFPLNDAERVIQEWLRLLPDGGRLDVVVPNFAWLADQYKNDPENVIFAAYGGPRGAHRYGYNATILSRLLQQVGLVGVNVNDAAGFHLSVSGHKAATHNHWMGQYSLVQSMKMILDAPFNIHDGYGTAAENILLALTDLGVDVYTDARWGQTNLDGLNTRTVDLIKRGMHAQDIGVRLCQPDSGLICPSKFKACWSMWEFLRMPPPWVQGANSVDLNIVPTNYCRQLWLEAGVNKPVVVVPFGHDPKIYHYIERPDRKTFTFLQAGTLSARKNPQITISAFQKLFPKRVKNVRLVMKSLPHLVLKDIDDERITVINDRYSHAQMVELLTNADCFVYPTYGEGFGLSVMEAMATGLPVITPDVTGLSDFVKEDYAYVVRNKGSVAIDSDFGDIGGRWDIDADHVADLMMHVYKNREEAKEKGRLASEAMQSWTWANAAKKLIGVLS